MKGLLRTRPAWSQFLVLISVCLVSVFVVSLAGLMVLSKTSGMSLTELGEMDKWDYSKPEIIFVLRGMQVIQFIGLFVIPVFLCARLFSTNTPQYLGFKMPANAGYLLAGVAVMIVSLPLITLLGELNARVTLPAWFGKAEKDAGRAIEALLSRHTIKDLLINIVCIAALAAVGEELLFRGIGQRLLIKMFKSPMAGIVVSAILFSALHMQFYGFLPRFTLGVFLGIMYWYSGSLWVAIIAHFVYDALMLILVYLKPEMINDDTGVSLNALAMAGAVSAALVFLAIRWMVKNSTTRYEEVYAPDAVPDNPFNRHDI